jgi:prepilin-type N-terminal cleavage/methylation domain-containing protein
MPRDGHSSSAGPRPASRQSKAGATARVHAGFTLVEVLAALLFMAIVIPVAMHGVSVASRAGILGQRKATAMRIAERVLEETIATGDIATGSPSGTITEGDITYPWTLTTEPWSEDSMTRVIVTVNFDVQGTTFDISTSTIYDPTALGASSSDSSSTGTTGTGTTAP